MRRGARTFGVLALPCVFFLACPGGGYPPGVMSAGQTGELGSPALRGSPIDAMSEACGSGALTEAGEDEIEPNFLQHPGVQGFSREIHIDRL